MALDPEGPGTRDVPGLSSSNSASGTVHGSLAQIGVVHGDVNLTTGAPVRTRYRETVRRIAPRALIGREAELAELAAFCTAPSTAGSYWWWRAAAWSGKSALMSTFVLNPPPGVRMVSFFITARMAAQNDRSAFIDNVLEQLVTLLDQPPPPLLTESTREAHLSSLLAEAAEACRDRGEHFVLLVDGLDEDRGVTTGSDAHSIAALLPADPPAGLRVIVAGRPNPSIPTDVPDHHPLRAAEVVRPLTPSPAAQAERPGLERELKRLLRGTSTEQDLLGLLTAAGGGLTATDLAELAGLSAWDVEDHLRTVTGRSFSRREGDHSDAYALGHEELHRMAVEALGHRLDAYRGRLHEWADRHRARRWPDDTPQYLLHDYFALLRLTDDVARMLACATDPDRHHLLLDRFGGDGVALAEILATQFWLVAEEAPDLIAIGRLAVHRDRLATRNTSLPRNLPGLWASLGRVARAVALAESFAETVKKDAAYLSVVRAIGRLGANRSLHTTRAVELTHKINDVVHRNRALAVLGRIGAVRENVEDLLDRQEAAVRLIENGSTRDRELAALARSTAHLGDLHRATALVESIADDAVRVRAQGSIALAVVAGGDLDRALALAEQVTDSTTRVRVTAEVAIAFGESGDVDQARRVLARLAGPGCAVTSDRNAVVAVRELAVLVGDQARADELKGFLDDAGQGEEPGRIDPRPPAAAASDLQRARERGNLIPGLMDREAALVQVIRGLAEIGEFAQADSLTSAVSHPWRRRDALAVLIPALIAAGRQDRAVAALHRTEVAARGDGDTAWRDRVLLSLATTVTGAGDLRQAEALSRSIADPADRAGALTAVSRAAWRRRDPAAARRLRAAATTAARSTANVERRDRALVAIVRAAAGQDDLAEAKALTDSLSTSRFHELALSSVARFDRASDVEEADAAPTPPAPVVAEEPHLPSPVVPDEVTSAIALGDLIRAAALTSSIAHPSARGTAIKALVTAVVATDACDRAQKIAVLTTICHRPSANRLARPWTLMSVMSVVDALVGAGEFDLAEQVARTCHDNRSQALWRVVEGALRVGDHDRANTVADSIAGSDLPSSATRLIPDLKPDTARRAAARGLGGEAWHRRAGVLARLSPAALEAVMRELAVVEERTSRAFQGSRRGERTPD
ncbi:hypothetical protein [Saccharothrix sp. HUAS TT1]|uniref:hypothetical protein n=1 Tax=unclassified Saccharothrix TaxID=2593673 RepID=UPI00345B609C